MKFIRFLRLVTRPVLHLIAEVDVAGLENIPASGCAIVASNHLGRLDAMLAVIISDREDFVLMIAEKYHKYFFWRWVMKNLDALWLNRYDADFDTLREVIKRVKRGEILAMAPEGTRSRTEALAQGKEGVAFLAVKTHAPVIPVAIWGTEDRLVKQRLFRLKRLKVYARIGDPYQLPPMPRGKERDAFLHEQTDEVMCRIAAMLPAQYHGVYANHPRLQALTSGRGSGGTAVSPAKPTDPFPGYIA